jgi:4a-hydroxytetrahydrobiopterin dehydratase
MWKEENNHLTKDFIFIDFAEAWAFLEKVKIVAEQLNHHPEITNMYNKVTLSLSTHDAWDIVTQKDHDFAKAVDSF